MISIKLRSNSGGLLVDINEVDNVKLLIGNKTENLKLFFFEGSLKAVDIFGQFLLKTFESR